MTFETILCTRGIPLFKSLDNIVIVKVSRWPVPVRPFRIGFIFCLITDDLEGLYFLRITDDPEKSKTSVSQGWPLWRSWVTVLSEGWHSPRRFVFSRDVGILVRPSFQDLNRHPFLRHSLNTVEGTGVISLVSGLYSLKSHSGQGEITSQCVKNFSFLWNNILYYYILYLVDWYSALGGTPVVMGSTWPQNILDGSVSWSVYVVVR